MSKKTIEATPVQHAATPVLPTLEAGGDEQFWLQPALEQLGDCEVDANGITTVIRRPRGDGVICARSAHPLSHEAALGQLERQIAAARERGQEPRLLVVFVGLNGALPHAERPDLLLIEQAAQEEWCRWIAFDDLDRIARRAEVAERFIAAMRRANVTVFAPLPVDEPLERSFSFSAEFERWSRSYAAQALRPQSLRRFVHGLRNGERELPTLASQEADAREEGDGDKQHAG